MGKKYNELTLEERIQIQRLVTHGESVRGVARTLGRAASTISRELYRLKIDESYNAQQSHQHAKYARHLPRNEHKLTDPVLWGAVQELLHGGWSPEQIAGILAKTFPDDRAKQVSHETIYTAIYLVPRGELRRELIACLRQGHSRRRPRSAGQDRRGQIPNMQSIHVRPPEIEDRQVPGHWEGDLIKGASNRSSVGTLVERSSGFVVLAKMSSARAADTLESFSSALERIPEGLRQTLTYDRGKEMSYHDALTLRTGVKVYFADPHAPWQRGSNENTNGLLRQYLPKGTDLSVYSQDELDAIALKLNTRPRKRHDWRTPLQVFTDHLQLAEINAGTMH